MARTKKEVRKIGNHTKEDMQKAVDLVKKGRSIHKAANECNLKYSTLRRYVKKLELDPDANVIPNYEINAVFTSEQEKALIDYITECALMFNGLTSKECRQFAYQMANRNKLKVPPSWIHNQIAGQDWYRSFKKRHSEFSLEKPETCSLARAADLNMVTEEAVFENLKEDMKGTSTSNVQRPENVSARKGSNDCKTTNVERSIQPPSKDPQLAAPSTNLSVSNIEVHVTEMDHICVQCWEAAMRAINESLDNVKTASDTHPSEVSSSNINQPQRVIGHSRVCITCGRSVLRFPSELVVRTNPTARQQQIQLLISNNIAPRQEDEPLSEKEIKVFCPKCKTEVTHTAEGIQDDQTKILVAKVYHYFEQEYEELKTIYGDLDLTPLSKFRQRTALATGVSESTVLHILQEEEGRNAEKRQEPPEERRRARKRYRDTNSSSDDDSSDDNAGNNEQSSNPQDAEMLVVKVESPESNNEEPEIYFPVSTVKAEVSEVEVSIEQAQNDPISIDVKTEPQADVVDDTNETLALTEPAGTKRKGRKISTKRDVTSTRTSETLALTEPAGTKRKGRIILRKHDVTSARQHSQGESSTAAASSSVLLTEELDKSSLIGDDEMKSEEIQEEEGIS